MTCAWRCPRWSLLRTLRSGGGDRAPRLPRPCDVLKAMESSADHGCMDDAAALVLHSDEGAPWIGQRVAASPRNRNV
eukprot:scaffold141996_cov39-Tisochrysis_lutea.AAC.1